MHIDTRGEMEHAVAGASRHRVIQSMEENLCELVAHGLQRCHRHRDRIATAVHRGGGSFAYCPSCEEDARLDDDIARQKRLRASMRSRS